jgi:hypothetical protein
MTDKENTQKVNPNTAFARAYRQQLHQASSQATQRLARPRQSLNQPTKPAQAGISAKAKTLLFRDGQKRESIRSKGNNAIEAKQTRKLGSGEANRPHVRHFKSLSNVSSGAQTTLRSNERKVPLKLNQNIANQSEFSLQNVVGPRDFKAKSFVETDSVQSSHATKVSS